MGAGAATLARAALTDDASRALIAALNAELSAMYPEPGATHFELAPEEVSGTRGSFLVASRDGAPIGCGALRLLDAETGELKRMYVSPAARGTGLGRRLVAALEVEARRLGVRRLVLETGIRQHTAIALYRATGFQPIPLYGEYTLSPHTSICLGKDLVGAESRSPRLDARQALASNGWRLAMGEHSAVTVPERVAATCRVAPGGAAWLQRLPAAVRDLELRWSLTLGAPFGEETSCAWVAPAVRADRTAAVLKLGMPHMEGEHEIEGLRVWNGDATVRLLEADDDLGAMLLERCEPGTPLRTEPEAEQDRVIAALLRRLWRPPPTPNPFRPLSALTAFWRDETLAQAASWADAGLVREGLRLLEELPRSAPAEVLLATDLHAGNVLRAQREPWLVIDPKPFVGDPAYDATQHLLNCQTRLRSDPDGTIRRFADLLGVDHERVRLWTFARAAAEPRENWNNGSMELARMLAP